MTKYTVLRATPADNLGQWVTLGELCNFLAECIAAGADTTTTAIRVDRPIEVWVERNSLDD